ncbi:TetR/AcrR family transcriptional regulator [Paenibacillus sp. FSL H7-0331]|uniref:TetR/AcrR family transcriptional regulator n=1 Tax=Paenibacillus sp. FSL H7-0331 TaxID=1920421 RepID=UPI00096EE931|nr:TetR/AcrR family transcriptional regulator [Paenibacillus sp. FSL H7-0331]OME92533.1 TetR family transcriptional regulator [Paenibacillus sp. FSL H7-0331]
MKTKKRDLKRELILKTVSQIVSEEGVEKLTLEAVAQKAGISKGGLLYHFPNKDSLILGVIEQLSNHFVEGFNKRANDDPHSKGKWTRSYIETSFFGESDVNDLYTAISAAQFTNPEMLQRLQYEYSEIQNKIENDELDPVRATLVRLAIDGIWFAEMFGLAPPKSDLRQKVIEQLKVSIQEVK